MCPAKRLPPPNYFHVPNRAAWTLFEPGTPQFGSQHSSTPPSRLQYKVDPLMTGRKKKENLSANQRQYCQTLLATSK